MTKMGSRLGAVVIAGGLATTLLPRPADAFCGFYVSGADKKLFNNATMVVLMRDGTRTVLSMQNNYEGPPEGFAMIVPVPTILKKENVKTLTADIFDKVDKLGAPRLVEYWEQDPCAHPALPQELAKASGRSGAGMAAPAATASAHGVTIEAQFTVGEYEIVILSAKDSTGLDTWLHDGGYRIPDGAEPYLRPYVQQGSKFFVAKVNPTKVRIENGQAMLSPLRFHYDSETFNLPIRLGLINSHGTQDLIVNILAPSQRYEASNYPNTTIPTNIDVTESAKSEFGGFYNALYDRTVETHPKAVVTEYAWQAGSCDPCPTPGLGPGEIATLGGDVLAPEGRYRDWVLTRLHARYTKDSLGEDLIFTTAPAITGGREQWSAPNKLEKGATKASYNNFQARYAIRHPWKGEIACDNPVRGKWGGPPATEGREGTPPPPPKAAAKSAFAPREGAKLASYVDEDVPEVALSAERWGAKPRNMAANAANATPMSTSKLPQPGSATPAPDTEKKPSGCAGCTVAGAEARGAGAMAALLGLVVLAWRRKR